MAYEYLEKFFGQDENGNNKALTFKELERALYEDKDLNLVNLSEGGYVSKEKFNSKTFELSETVKKLNEANTQINSFKEMDIEGIKKSASEWEQKYTTDMEALKKQLELQARQYSEELFLANYNFSSKAAREGILSELRQKQFQIDNGTLVGAKEYIQSLMEDDDYKAAFVLETQKNPEIEDKPVFSTGSSKAPDPSNGDGNKSVFNFGFTNVRNPISN